MNYFAHGFRFLDDPFFLAGVAAPDWLSAADRKSKVRRKTVLPHVDSDDPRTARVAQGILQHHKDDHWFHSTRAFSQLALEFTANFRDLLPSDRGFRPSFVGHILVELLLDDFLIQQDPSQLDRYYSGISSLEPGLLSQIINQMTTQPANNLEHFIRLFSRVRFLKDYAQDGTLLLRLNGVMRRVGLPELPSGVVAFFPAARAAVHRFLPDLDPRNCP